MDSTLGTMRSNVVRAIYIVLAKYSDPKCEVRRADFSYYLIAM